MEKTPLNKELDVSNFTICVPKNCTLGGQIDSIEEEDGWRNYLCELHSALGHDCDPEEVDLPKNEDGQTECSDCITTDDETNGWILQGKLALEHSLRVHRWLRDEFLRLPSVSGMDVGFAIWERDHVFEENYPALRAHVPTKKPYGLLKRQGWSSLTSFKYLLPRIYFRIFKDGKDSKGQNPEWEFFAPFLFRRLQHLLFTGEPDSSPKKRDRSGSAKTASDSGITFDQFRHRLQAVMEGPLRGNFFYPIQAVHPRDLGCYPKPCANDDELPFDRVRLTICGVPLDVIGADYRVQSRHRNRAGVFVQHRATSVELDDEELEVTGRDRVDPLVGGISVGSVTGQAGTLGAIVWDREDGAPCILGNWHVLAGSTSAEYGQPCYQPSLFDGGTEADVVAHLDRWHIGVDGDAALAKLSGARAYVSGEVLGMWHSIAGDRAPELGMTVRKWGRTSGFTKGFVDGIEMTVDIDYSGKPRRFEDQFHLSPLKRGDKVSEPGDSGALVLHDCFEEEDAHHDDPDCSEDVVRCLKDLGFDLESRNKKRKEERERRQRRTYLAVGMIFAGDTPGSPLGEFAIASKITTLAERLDFSLRPVYAPRSSFRSLVTEPVADRAERLLRDDRALAPGGIGGDHRGGGPTPDPEQSQSGGGG